MLTLENTLLLGTISQKRANQFRWSIYIVKLDNLEFKFSKVIALVIIYKVNLWGGYD